MENYSVAHCINMIRHYDEQSKNWTKPEAWRSLARLSAAEWRLHLEAAEVELAA